MTSARLETRSLSKSFGEHQVLDGIDLTLAPGTTTAVLGASGCGKTTLLRIVAGFETPDGGAVLIDGHTVAESGRSVPAHRRNVGYVAQDGALFPHLTVGQNVAYGLRGGIRRGAVASRVTELLAAVSLGPEFAARRPSELSGGQQQRVALARALARRPVLMLLDEPFSALDTGLRATTRRTVTTALSEAGVTTLLVTHDQEEALSVADQVAVMADGRFHQVGSPRDVYTAPCDRFTAEFLGDCVILTGTVRDGHAQTVLGPIPVHGPDRSEAAVMLRPNQLAVHELSDHDGAIGTVTAVEFLGSDVMLTISTNGHSAPMTVRQSSVTAPTVNAKVGASVVGHGVVLAQHEPGKR